MSKQIQFIITIETGDPTTFDEVEKLHSQLEFSVQNTILVADYDIKTILGW